MKHRSIVPHTPSEWHRRQGPADCQYRARQPSIVLADNSTLLTRNLRDFQRVPDLKVEDWLS